MTQLAQDRTSASSLEASLAPVGATAAARPDPQGIPWTRYSGRISYSACNEDSHSELRALRLRGDDRVLCITAGGGRVLNLLVAAPAEIWAVDVNPSQSHLLELQIAALRGMTHAAYLGFLGVRPSATRPAAYEGLRHRLSPAARAYFDDRPAMIAAGVLFQGNIERYLKLVAVAAHALRPLWVHRLFAARDLAAQRPLVEGWHALPLQALIHTVCHRGFLERFSRDPGFWRFVPPEVSLPQRISDCIFRYLLNHLARDSHLLQLVFHGRYINEDALPPYLNAATYDRIRAALERTPIRILSGQLADVVREAPPESLDAFSITDVSSYLSEPAFHDLVEQMLRTARPGARLCSRGIFAHRDFAPEHRPRLRREAALERRLAFDDLAMVHQFVVANIA